MKIIDTHAHYAHPKYKNRHSLLKSMHDDGIDFIVDVGTDTKSIKDSLELSKLPFVYSGIGYFPNNCLELENKSIFDNFEKLLDSPKVVYLGEIGLDYHWNTVPQELQQKYFKIQIELAKKHNLPISIHSRDAEKDTMKVLKDFDKLDGIVHCFSYGEKAMEFFVDKGLHLGVGGTITYKSNKFTRDAITKAPIEKLVLETDAPYLTPYPHNREINDSRFISLVIDEIASLKSLDRDFVETTLYENTQKLLNLK